MQCLIEEYYSNQYITQMTGMIGYTNLLYILSTLNHVNVTAVYMVTETYCLK